MKEILARRLSQLAVFTGVALAINAVSVPQASAQQVFVTPHSSADQEHSTELFWGADLLRKGYSVDVGIVHALNKNIGTDGWLIAVTGTRGQEGNNEVVPHSSTRSWEASALVGYQWDRPNQTYFALFGGVHFVDNNESPFDPQSKTDGSKVGAKVEVDFETTRDHSLYTGVNASYSTVNDKTHARVRAGYQAEEIKFGPEFTVSAEKGENAEYRYGFFVGGIKIGPAFMSVSAGRNREAGSSNNGFYALLEFETEF